MHKKSFRIYLTIKYLTKKNTQAIHNKNIVAYP